jgi:hypothetical protein
LGTIFGHDLWAKPGTINESKNRKYCSTLADVSASVACQRGAGAV